jgi:hypothetical protein
MRDGARSLALVAVLLVSTLAGVVPATALADSSAPSGMVALDDSAISSEVPSGESLPVSVSDFEGGKVLASDHAASMSLTLTTASHADEVMGTDAARLDGDDMALVLSDDTHHAGREVAIEATVLRDARGYLPQTVNGLHDDGSPWERPVRYRDGFVVFEVPEFSANTVTFGGTVELSGDPATDGSTYTYDLGDLDAATAPNLTFEGTTATEWDNETGSTAPGGSASIAPAGLGLDPSGPSSDGKPTLTATAPSTFSASQFGGATSAIDFVGKDGVGVMHSEVRIDNPPEKITKLDVGLDVAYDSNDQVRVDVSIAGGDQTDGDFGEGSLVKDNWNPPGSAGTTTINLDSPYEPSQDTITVEFYTVQTAETNAYFDINYDRNGPSGYFESSNYGSLGPADVIAKTNAPTSVGASADDGTSASFGDFSAGESKTREFDVSREASSLSWSGSGAALDWTLRMQERSETRDPGVELNGNWTNHTGTLAPGETATDSLSKSSLRSGTNRLNVSLAETTDAPAPQVDLTFSHTARDDQSIAYTGNVWSERYNVSRTYGAPTANATLTVPFAGHVVSVSDLRVFLNGTETAPTYSTFQNTTLTVGLGDLHPGTETRVLVNGSKVQVRNGSIQVADPTTTGNDLNSEVEVTSRDSGKLAIAYGGTGSGDRVHYAVNESWSGASEVHRATASGDRELRMDAPDGGTFRVQTLPVEAKPKQGDVELSVSEPRQEEPQFYVRPGDSPGDTVKFTYLNANADQKYLLYSKSEGVVRESGTANSPVTLTDDDSAERLVVRLDDSGTSQPPTNDWTDGFPTNPAQFEQASSGGNLPVVLLVSGLGIALLWYLRRSTRGASGVAGLAGRALSSNVVLGALVVAVVGVGAAVGGVSLPPGAGLFLLVTGVPLATYLGLRKAGQYSHIAFGAVTAVALILGLQLLGGNVVSSVLSNLGPSMPIFAIGGLVVAYSAVKAYQKGKTVNLSVRGIRQSSNDEEGGS